MRRALLIVILLTGATAFAAPQPGVVVLRGSGREASFLSLTVPLRTFAQLQQPGGGGSSVNLSQVGGGSVSSSLYDSGNTAIKVNCVVGCSATSGFSDNSAFTAGSTSVNNISGVYNDSIASLTNGNAGAIRATSDRMLFVNLGKLGGTALSGANVVDTGNTAFRVNCVIGCGSSSFSDSSAFTAGSTAIQNVGGVFNDGLSAVSSGNAAAPRITSSRAFHVNLRNNSGSEIGTSGSPIRVDPTGTTAQPVTGTFWQATQPVSGTFWQATQPVSGTFWQATQPVSGPLTDTQLRATAVPVSGTITASGPLTDTQLRASAVAVSGPLTDTQLRATAVPVSGTVTANQGTAQTAANGWPIRASDGTNLINVGDNTNSAVRVNVVAGGGAGGTSSTFNAAFPATGTAAGATDGTNMKPLTVDASGYLRVNVSAGGGSGGTSSSYGAAFPATGTAAGFSDGTNMQGARVFDADSGAGTQYLAGAILRKSASGGSVEAGTSSDPLRIDPTGTTTQPVSISAALPAGTNNIGDVDVASLPNVTIGTFPDNEPFNLAQWGGAATSLGQKTAANSVPVVPASDYTPPDTSTSSTALGASGATVSVALAGQQGAGFVILGGGNLVGTLTPEISFDGGTTWSGSYFYNPATTAWNSSLAVSSPSATQLTVFTPAGSSNVRVRVSAYTSGSSNATARATLAIGPQAFNPCQSAAVSQAAISVSTAATTQLVALASGKNIYVCHLDFISAGTTNVTFEYGTGSNCGTGTTTLTGAYNTTAQVGIAKSGGGSVIYNVPSGNAFCVVNSAAVQVSGSVTYVQP